MKYNLTPNQKEFAKSLVNQVREKNLAATFFAYSVIGGLLINFALDGENKTINTPDISGELDALANSQLLIQRFFGDNNSDRKCTLTGLIYTAVDSDFKEEDSI